MVPHSSINGYYQVECFMCRKKMDERFNNTVCKYCGGPLDVIYDYEYLKYKMNTYMMQYAPPQVMKYLDFYPLLQRQDLTSLGEGSTQLLHATKLAGALGIKNLFIKNEGNNPTGAFKDRGSFVEINKAKELGYRAVCVASTGNMAASVSAYCSQAGMTCYVFVPENTPAGKLAQAISYGAQVIRIKGHYSDAFNLTVEVAKHYGFYLAGDYAFRGEGQKSLAYETCEQLQFKQIDWVLVPVGMGTNLSYIWKGFKEYYMLGLIDWLPKMVAVQAEGASPIVTAFRKQTAVESQENYLGKAQRHRGTKAQSAEKPGNDFLKLSPVEPLDSVNTVCTAIAVANPIDAPKALTALHESNGTALAVSDSEILAAQSELARLEALFTEPSSAVTIAALRKLIFNGIIKSDDTIVCVATGSGLKDPSSAVRTCENTLPISPVLAEVVRALDST